MSADRRRPAADNEATMMVSFADPERSRLGPVLVFIGIVVAGGLAGAFILFGGRTPEPPPAAAPPTEPTPVVTPSPVVVPPPEPIDAGVAEQRAAIEAPPPKVEDGVRKRTTRGKRVRRKPAVRTKPTRPERPAKPISKIPF